MPIMESLCLKSEQVLWSWHLAQIIDIASVIADRQLISKSPQYLTRPSGKSDVAANDFTSAMTNHQYITPS